VNLVRRAATELRSMPAGAGMSLTNLDNLMSWSAYGFPTYTGKAVSQQTALTMDAVWACVDVLSGDIASSPFLPYRRTGEMLSSGRFQRELATDHYLWPLLTHQVNPEMTAWRFKKLAMVWLCLWGNAYAEVEINGRGQVVALWPWRPDRVKVFREVPGGPLVYAYRMDTGKVLAVPHDRMLHLRGLGIDGLMGLSPIDVHRETIGLSLAIQEHGARFFGNGARPLGILEHPGKLSKEGGPEEVRKNWEMMHGGLNNAHRIAILQEGMKYHEVGMTMVNAQYAEVAKLGPTAMARIFRVPPHRIADLDRSTNNNIEHQGLEYVQYGVGPWGANWQNEFAFSLLSAREADSIFLEFDFTHLLSGDMTAQSQFFGKMIESGVLVPDEVRERLGYNPFGNGWGAKPWRPANMNLVDAVPPPTPAIARL
jgi:HK97 family phage portal protein